MEENISDIIAQLPSKVFIHDLSFDWAGRRIAAACSDKVVRIYTQKFQGGWIQQKQIKIQGASIWKVKWARPQLGVILATCSLDRQIRIYQFKKVQKNQGEKNDWLEIHSIQENSSIQDIKFTPFKNLGLSLAIGTISGMLKIMQPDDHLQPSCWSICSQLLINQCGINCLSWSKKILRQDLLLAIGCRSSQKIYHKNLINTSQNTVHFIVFKKNKQLQQIKHPISQISTVNDISWALMNGRSYYLLGIATDTAVKIYQLNISDKDNYIQQIKIINLSNTSSYRLSWNIMGTYLSVSQKKKIKIWRSSYRSNWIQVKQIDDN